MSIFPLGSAPSSEGKSDLKIGDEPHKYKYKFLAFNRHFSILFQHKKYLMRFYFQQTIYSVKMVTPYKLSVFDNRCNIKVSV